MPSTSYLPPKDSDLDLFAQNVDTKLTAAPTSYGLVAGDATAFHTVRLAFTTALVTASSSSTRTKETVAAKNLARFNMVTDLRNLAARIQAYPSITPTLLAGLGLTVRSTHPTPIPPPSSNPVLALLSSSGGGVKFRFSDSVTPDSRSKPPGAIAMLLFASVGLTPPGSVDDTHYVGSFTKNTTGPGSRSVVINFSGADVGKKAYLIGRWINRRGELGPVSPTASMTIAA